MIENIKVRAKEIFCVQDVYIDPEVEEKIDMEYICENVTSWDDEKSKKNLVRSFASLSNELKEGFPYYGTIISDDASGRLLSLFFRKIINKKREELGKEPASTYFLTSWKGRYKEVNEGIDEFLREKVDSYERVLVLTEHIDSGASLSPIVDSLEKQEGVDFDIASISVNEYFRLPNELENKVIYVSKGKMGELLTCKKFCTGVEKNKAVEIGIHPQKRKGDETQELLNQAREEIGLIADEVYKAI